MKNSKKIEYHGYSAYETETAMGRTLWEIYDAADKYLGDFSYREVRPMINMWIKRKENVQDS